jgi:molecular chaperone DnaK (HSP70)
MTDAKNVIIGIDLGTTYSCVSVWKDGAPVVIPSASGRTMPSWVAFDRTLKIVGDAAKAQSSSNPTNTVYDVKRILGRSFHDPIVQAEKKGLPYEIIEGSRGEPKILVDWNNAKKELSPEEVSATRSPMPSLRSRLTSTICSAKPPSMRAALLD